MPSMLEAGVSGISRDRAWDVVVAVEVPSLIGSPLTRVSFYVLAPGEVEVVGTDGTETVAPEALKLFIETASAGVTPPLESRAVRTTDELWSVAARKASRKLADLELPAGVSSVSVARAPDGEVMAHIDGELVIEPAGELALAVAEIVELAEREQDAFVATLERFASGRVALSIDPL
ncbi:MAG: hypothetical protein ACR2OD_05130 [Gaiellaceae bacterium]